MSYEVIRFRYNCHRMDTEGFTLDYEAADDDLMFHIPIVYQDTINGLSNLVHAVTGPHKAKLKKEIAYLIGMRDRQLRAWKNKLQEFKTRQNNTDKWVQEHTQ